MSAFSTGLGMSLRTKLLLLALSTLVLPLAGWTLARQFEALLREGQAQVQLASAQMLTRAVVAQARALPEPGPALFVQVSEAPLMLDGYDEDWRAQGLASQVPAPGLRVALALAGGQLHLFAAVPDRTPVRADADGLRAAHADQLLLVLEDAAGLHRLRLASAAPGPLQAKVLSDPDAAPRVLGEWQETGDGYQMELRFPAGYLPERIGFEVLDFNDPALPPQRSGTAPDLPEGRWLVQQAPVSLQQLLQHLVPDGVRASLVQSDGWVLARGGHFEQGSGHERAGFWRRLLYRALTPEAPLPLPDPAAGLERERVELWQALAERPAFAWYALERGQGLLLSTAVPVRVEGRTRAALVLERPSESLLLGGRALTGLLLASVLAMSLVGLVLFAFAGHLSGRIRVLSRAAERATSRAGRNARAGFDASTAGDELGDLSRSFARLLEEVEAYSGYLQGLAGTLSHELHTPIAVVRSSLENLEAEPLADAARTYVARARDGVERLGAIVRAMSQASRVERAIDDAEDEEFDLAALLADCAEGYRALLAPRTLQIDLPESNVPFRGAPDLIVQALDKLIDNARSFCPPDGWVRLMLLFSEAGIELAVANSGPPLPDAMQERLFDSLVSLRGAAQRADGNSPHLGFGLHVVRLVAQRHGGQARARNLPGGEGVEFRLVLRAPG